MKLSAPGDVYLNGTPRIVCDIQLILQIFHGLPISASESLINNVDNLACCDGIIDVRMRSVEQSGHAGPHEVLRHT